MEVIENIDIGGVCFLERLLKLSPCSICVNDHYQKFMENYQLYTTLELFRKELACQAWEHVAYTTSKLPPLNPKITYRKYCSLEKLNTVVIPITPGIFIHGR